MNSSGDLLNENAIKNEKEIIQGEHADHRRLGMVPVVDGDGDQNKEKELSSNHFYSPKKTTDKIR